MNQLALMPVLDPISEGRIDTRSVAPWIIDQGFVTLQHPTKLTQHLGVICLEIHRNREYFSRPLVLAVSSSSLSLVLPRTSVHTKTRTYLRRQDSVTSMQTVSSLTCRNKKAKQISRIPEFS